jgi:hypothetical protein
MSDTILKTKSVYSLRQVQFSENGKLHYRRIETPVSLLKCEMPFKNLTFVKE